MTTGLGSACREPKPFTAGGNGGGDGRARIGIYEPPRMHRDDEEEAAAREVLGVPYFLINRVWPIPGAQDVETMEILLRRAWSRLGH